MNYLSGEIEPCPGSQLPCPSSPSHSPPSWHLPMAAQPEQRYTSICCGIPTTRLPFTTDATLSRCSLSHSRHMAQEGYISHDQFPSDVCGPHSEAGENVGVVSLSTNGALTLHRTMMDEGPCPNTGCPGAEHEAHGH